MKRANYEIIQETPHMVVLRDIGPWDQYLTITNAAEQVCDLLAPMLKGRKLFYYDSEDEFCELMVADGKFAGFRHAGGPA